MLRTLPISVTKADLKKLSAELKHLITALSSSGIATTRGSQNSAMASREFEIILGQARDYYRIVRTLLMAQQSSQFDGEFDDHDQLASLSLYSRHREPLFSKYILTRWLHLNPKNAGTYSSRNKKHKKKKISLSGAEFGIVTALEHEYQSILRRLDQIEDGADDNAHGFAILDRLGPEDDLKDGGVEGRQKKVGITFGSIGSNRVVVICVGSAGEEAAREGILETEMRMETVPKQGWLVVGVCAGTSRNWPIGTVLISRDAILGLSHIKSNLYTCSLRLKPLSFPVPEEGYFSMQVAFRAVPKAFAGVEVAPASKVPVEGVRYACPDHVINLSTDCAIIIRSLQESGLVDKDEPIGIEMEALGAAIYGVTKVCVVKGVCDYGDDSKASWPPGMKMLFQLYAAETAAEYASQVVRTTGVRGRRTED